MEQKSNVSQETVERVEGEMETEIKIIDLLDAGPDNLVIQDALGKCLQQVRNHDNILCSVSGGSDSDVMADLIIRCGGKEKTTFAFFNTGLEYKATKQQIKNLEEKYGIKIEVLPPIKPIPICVKEYGVPFWSKTVSEYIYRLQRHNFQWEDEPFDVLLAKYPNCKAALRWWCNNWPPTKNGQESSFNISYAPYLKEFMVSNPPTFRISAKCCTYAKKEVARKFEQVHDFDLNCTGVRKAEKAPVPDRSAPATPRQWPGQTHTARFSGLATQTKQSMTSIMASNIATVTRYGE